MLGFVSPIYFGIKIGVLLTIIKISSILIQNYIFKMSAWFNIKQLCRYPTLEF